MAQIFETPEMESRNCAGGTPGTLNHHNSRLQSWIATRSEPKLQPSSRSFQRHVALSNRTSEGGRFQTFSGPESNCEFEAVLLPITWAADVRIANARAFSISTFQELSNDTKNTPMRGVFPLLSSSKHSGFPKDYKSQLFRSVGLHPHTWPKQGCDTCIFQNKI